MLTSVEIEFCDELFVFIFEVLSYLLLSCKPVAFKSSFTSFSVVMHYVYVLFGTLNVVNY